MVLVELQTVGFSSVFPEITLAGLLTLAEKYSFTSFTKLV